MGYCSEFRYEFLEEVEVNLSKVQELENFFASDNPDVYGFYGVKLETNGEKLQGIKLEDDYAKFYDCQLFAQKLAEVVVQGCIRLHFIGEDGNYWGYEVTPGKVQDLCAVSMTAEEQAAWRQFREELKVLKALYQVPDDKVLVKGILGTGPHNFKIPPGTTAGDVKAILKWLFTDLKVDLGIDDKPQSDES